MSEHIRSVEEHKELIFTYLQRWGTHASIVLMERACDIFSITGVEGIIGCHMQPRCAVVFGDPLCSSTDRTALIKAFHAYCKKQRKRIVYLNTSEEFATWFYLHYKSIVLHIGQELIVNPMRDVMKETGSHACLLRKKYKKCIKEGLEVKEYIGYDPSLEKQLEAVGNAWLKNRKGPQSFLFPLNIFTNRTAKRWFYAMQHGNIIGLLFLNQLPAQRGWLVNMLMCTPEASQSTSDFLLLKTLEQLRAENCNYFSTGLIPPSEIGSIMGASPSLQWVTRKLFKVTQKILKLHNGQRYWRKFEPEQKSCCVIINRSFLGTTEIVGLMRTLHAL